MPPNTVNDTPLPNGAVAYQSDQISLEKNEIKEERTGKIFKTEIKWGMALYFIGLHLGCLYTLLIFPFREQLFLLGWSIVTGHFGLFGITAGAHRLWAHRSYKAKTPLRIILAMVFYSTGMNPLYDWIRVHRIHHKFTDTDADPHNAKRGFWYSHLGWTMLKRTDLGRKYGKSVDMSDIANDPVVQFFDRNYALFMLLFTVIVPTFIPVYFFNQNLKWTLLSQLFIRYPYVLNATASINSVAHSFGSHTYDKTILPVENRWLSILTPGEGWHNYHHVFPWDYQTAELKSFLFNQTKFMIDCFAKIGWAYDMKTVTPEQIKKIVETKGDGTHPIYGK